MDENATINTQFRQMEKKRTGNGQFADGAENEGEITTATAQTFTKELSLDTWLQTINCLHMLSQ